MSGSTTETVTAIAAVAAATAASIQVIFLFVAAWFTRHQLALARDQLREAQTLREEQTRPFVVVDFHVSGTVIDLTVENLGTTLARDVRICFDEAPVSTFEPPHGKLSFFQEPIPSFPPRKKLSTLFDFFPDRIKSGFPLAYRGRVTYRDERGTRFDDEFVLDLGHYVDLTHIRRADDIHDVLEGIRKELAKWTSSGGGGASRATSR